MQGAYGIRGRVLLGASLLLCLAAAISGPLGCGRQERSGSRGFYYWRTTFELSAREEALLNDLQVTKLYVRLFDLAWNSDAGVVAPIAPCILAQEFPTGVELVPVVYIKNEVFANEHAPRTLAEHVWLLVTRTMADAQAPFSEIQVDCDWTDSTREAYFAFCERLGEVASSEGRYVSATIRLHQVKYRYQTGVPPVKRGMLMFYNVGRFADASERSPIFNSEDAGRYVATIDAYPLPLDAALPIFSWGLHLRDGQVIGLISKPDLQDLVVMPGMVAESSGILRAAQAGFVNGDYLQEGDLIRIDGVTPAIAHEAAGLLAKYFHPRGDFTITLFDLDERNTAGYAAKDLDLLYSTVR